jgi:hypothetical protein
MPFRGFRVVSIVERHVSGTPCHKIVAPLDGHSVAPYLRSAPRPRHPGRSLERRGIERSRKPRPQCRFRLTRPQIAGRARTIGAGAGPHIKRSWPISQRKKPSISSGSGCRTGAFPWRSPETNQDCSRLRSLYPSTTRTARWTGGLDKTARLLVSCAQCSTNWSKLA